jgi:hypothetical protein
VVTHLSYLHKETKTTIFFFEASLNNYHVVATNKYFDRNTTTREYQRQLTDSLLMLSK